MQLENIDLMFASLEGGFSQYLNEVWAESGSSMSGCCLFAYWAEERVPTAMPCWLESEVEGRAWRRRKRTLVESTKVQGGGIPAGSPDPRLHFATIQSL